METDKNFKLFSDCIPVKGAKRSAICDVGRNRTVLIPNVLYEILTLHDGKKIDDIIDVYGFENKASIVDYFSFLFENEFIFFCTESEIDLFPPIERVYEYSGQISNCIIDVDHESNHDFKKVFNELHFLQCRSIEIRFYDKIKIKELNTILQYSTHKNFRSIELIVPFIQDIKYDDIELLFERHPMSKIVFHGVPLESKDSVIEIIETSKLNLFNVVFSTEIITDVFHCGQISPDYFSTNLLLFMESQENNNCLNKKISIDKRGEIKNCPSMAQSFGNVNDLKLVDVVNKTEFRKYWSITKDQIEVCKDCEFRFICTDCRAYLEKPLDLYSKPLKCGYNPYTAEWQDLSKNPLKTKTMQLYQKM